MTWEIRAYTTLRIQTSAQGFHLVVGSIVYKFAPFVTLNGPTRKENSPRTLGSFAEIRKFGRHGEDATIEKYKHGIDCVLTINFHYHWLTLLVPMVTRGFEYSVCTCVHVRRSAPVPSTVPTHSTLYLYMYCTKRTLICFYYW